jgi:hypothetical protein
MVQGGGLAGLLEEPLAEGRVLLRQLRREHLQGDLLFQPKVLGEINHSHAAAAQHGVDPVRAELGAHPRVRAHGQTLLAPAARRPGRADWLRY